LILLASPTGFQETKENKELVKKWDNLRP